jgi:hypothetical protein
MKKMLTFIFVHIITLNAIASIKDSTIYYKLPDSVKAVQFMAEINVSAINSRKEMFAGIHSG